MSSMPAQLMFCIDLAYITRGRTEGRNEIYDTGNSLPGTEHNTYTVLKQLGLVRNSLHSLLPDWARCEALSVLVANYGFMSTSM